MGCGDTPQSVISIWIQIWIWIQSMDLHGVWRHFTFYNIHMNMDVAPYLHIITLTYLYIKMDLFKIGTILFIIIQGF